MRILAPIALIVVVALVVVFVVTREDEDSYQVRAIFDNAGFIIPGEDVKIAGVKVGKVSDLEVTADFKAAVVLEITEPGYQDFRSDATCIVRPQNLIGERFVECKPTQPRTANAEPPPQLREIEDGPGEGQYLLPVQNTMQTVDIDLIGNTMREPERERLSLILNELGTGVAGRGKDLNEVIRRANPALQETDKVLQILARQNDQLEQLAVNSDTVLAPLARDREQVASAIRNSSEVAQATAEKRDALAADIQTLPRFLDELEPTMVRLGRAGRRVHARVDRPRSERDRHQQPDPPARPVLGGRDARHRLARRGVEDRHARGDRRAPRDRRPARAGEGRAARRRDAARRCSSPSATPAASSARWTTSSTKRPRSTASTRSGTTCARACWSTSARPTPSPPSPAARRSSRRARARPPGSARRPRSRRRAATPSCARPRRRWRRRSGRRSRRRASSRPRPTSQRPRASGARRSASRASRPGAAASPSATRRSPRRSRPSTRPRRRPRPPRRRRHRPLNRRARRDRAAGDPHPDPGARGPGRRAAGLPLRR